MSIAPQRFFVEPLLDPGTHVIVALPPSADPRTWIASPAQIERLSSADLYFRIGLPFEEHVLASIHVTNPDQIVVDAREGVALRRVDRGEDESPGIDPYIWLGFAEARQHVRTTATLLIQIRPDRAGRTIERMESVLEEIDRIESEITESLQPFSGAAVYVSHPVLGYLLDDLALRQISPVSFDPSIEGDAYERVLTAAREDGVSMILVQRERIVAAGDPILFDPYTGGWIATVRSAAAAIENALRD